MREGREVPGERRDGARVLEGEQCHRQEVQRQRRSLTRAPGLARCAVFPEMRESRQRARIERRIVAGLLGPALRQAREVGIGDQQFLREDAAERETRRSAIRCHPATGPGRLAKQQARGP